MDCHDSPWLFAVWVFCFGEDTIVFHQNLIANLVIVIDVRVVFAGHVMISLTLPTISYFVPVRYKQDVEEHVASEYCCAWRGVKDCAVGRANGPCRIIEEDVHVIGGYWLSHIKLSSA